MPTSNLNFNILENSIASLSQILEEQMLSVYGSKITDLFKTLSTQSDLLSGADLSSGRQIISSLSLSEIRQLTHCFTVFFLLNNQAEQCEIIRIKRQRQLNETKDNPRSESVYEAVKQLKELGKSAQEVKELCSQLALTPTFTAHPTESRRRSVLKKQLKVAECLFALSDQDLPPLERDIRLSELKALVLNMLLTDDVRATRLSVQDEVENGLFFLAGSVVEIVPSLVKDLKRAFSDYYSQDLGNVNPVHYRSWIGGDRDGNPKVTCETTRAALAAHKQDALNYYIRQVKLLRDELSISSRKIALSEAIEESSRRDKELLKLNPDDLIDAHQVYEPFREKCDCIRLKLKALLASEIKYDENDFLADLNLIRNSLTEIGLQQISENGTLEKLITQLEAFGFYLAKLDLRQHSEVHQQTIHEILNLSGICADYKDLQEADKVKILSEVLETNRDFSLSDLSEQALELVNLFRLIRQLQISGNQSLDTYIISMTHSISDMLEPLVLWKVAAPQAGDFPLDLSPLFETIDDLENCGKLLSSIFNDRQYQKYLASRNNFQEIMLGYSDSNKDGGYASANILLYEAQLQISRTCLEKNVKFQIFHGRGGSVGRGGGRAGRAIMASPAESQNGRVRLTEQGEVISFRYSMPELGHRHLEQILSAILLSTQMQEQSLAAEELSILKSLAAESMAKYRSLVEHQDFWEWYVRITPIKFISSLPIASRPVMRSGTNLEFENLRAIPWVFSWTQTRYNVPSWFGLGTALNKLLQDKKMTIKELQEFYLKRTFFRTLIDNAQQEMARARLEIAKLYIADTDLNLYQIIEQEFYLTEKIILQISQQDKLLDNNPVIQKSISRRNPYTDPLSLIQIELLKRSRQKELSEDLTEAMHMTISGLAAAMQTTG